jgi:hypothetical protein
MNAPPPGPDRAGARHRRRRPGPRRSGGEGRGRFAKHHAQNKPALHEAPAAAILRPLSGPRFGCQGARGRECPRVFRPAPRWGGVAGPAPLSPEGRPRRSTGRAVRTAAPGGGTDLPPAGRAALPHAGPSSVPDHAPRRGRWGEYRRGWERGDKFGDCAQLYSRKEQFRQLEPQNGAALIRFIAQTMGLQGKHISGVVHQSGA